MGGLGRGEVLLGPIVFTGGGAPAGADAVDERVAEELVEPRHEALLVAVHDSMYYEAKRASRVEKWACRLAGARRRLRRPYADARATALV